MSRTDDIGFTPEAVDQQIDHYLSGAQTAPEEQAAQRAAQRLQRAYHVRSEEHAPSLERVWQRVLACETRESALAPAVAHGRERADEQGEALALRANPRTSRQERRRARGRMTFFAQLVAAFCLLLIVGSFALVTALSHRGQSTSPNTVHGKPVALQTIHMFDAQSGWAITADHLRILHTSAGIDHWQDVSPSVHSQSSIADTDFYAPSSAWVAMNNGAQLFLYRTHDSGQTWQQALVPDQCLGGCQIDVLNTQLGWLLVGKGAATGSEAVDVLRTHDGGATWKVIATSSYNTVNNPAAIPFSGDKTGLSFVNETTGWIVGDTAATNFAWFYVTRDGGVTWQHQPIALPTGAFQVSTLPPIFFNASDGVLPVAIPGAQSQAFNLYVTHNGGTSWTPTTTVPGGAIAGMIDVVDATHGWVANNTYAVTGNQYKNSTIYYTSDGGQHWARYTTHFNADLTEIDFVSQAQGWALDSSQTLYQTTNGGQSWTKAAPAEP